jgi:hypothetical protein
MQPNSIRSAARRATGTAIAAVVALFLIFFALLGVGNEIRYQGCVARIDQQKLTAATQNPRNPEPVTLDCDRSPF